MNITKHVFVFALCGSILNFASEAPVNNAPRNILTVVAIAIAQPVSQNDNFVLGLTTRKSEYPPSLRRHRQEHSDKKNVNVRPKGQLKQPKK